jgi:hypothetical protein
MRTAVSRPALRRSFNSRSRARRLGKVGQIVVQGDVGGALFGVNTRLKLHQHGGDGLEGVDLRGFPGAKFEVDESEHTPGGVAEQQGNGRPHHDVELGAPAFFDAVHVLVAGVVQTGEIGLTEVFGRHKEGVCVKAHFAQRIGTDKVGAGRPLGLQNAETPDVVVAAQKGDVGVEKLGQHPGRPGERLRPGGGRRRHQAFGDLAHQFIQATLVEENTFAGGLGGHLAKESAEGFHNGKLALAPHPTVARHEERPHDLTTHQFDGLNEDSPLGVLDRPGK